MLKKLAQRKIYIVKCLQYQFQVTENWNFTKTQTSNIGSCPVSYQDGIFLFGGSQQKSKIDIYFQPNGTWVHDDIGGEYLLDGSGRDYKTVFLVQETSKNFGKLL